MKTIGKLLIIIFILYCFCPQIVIGGYNIVKNKLSNIHIEFKTKSNIDKKDVGLLIPPNHKKEDIGLLIPN